ncbi:hypothetical protein U1872_12415 [Sphingomonas sp. RB3P16]|uniref:hypothetical protein n=1 Tax=Parasphingomonas frigoris TaxID=3096163 RepID=UPI002FC61334
MTDIYKFYPPIEAPIVGSEGDPREERARGGLLSFGDVEERLIEAMLVCWRNPDRERGWMRIRSAWPDVAAEPGDYDARGGDQTSSDVEIRPASLTRLEVAEMEEAFGWVDCLTPIDRKLVGLVISQLARGAKQVPWMKLRGPMGLTRGAEGLRKRYERAIGAVCRRVNGGFLASPCVKPVNHP